MNDKIGIGISTTKNASSFQKCIDSIPDGIGNIYVVNDTAMTDRSYYVYPKTIKEVKEHEVEKGLGFSKNELLRTMIQDGCDWLFLIEDHMLVKNPLVFQKYMEGASKSGIYHMNFGFSNIHNLDKEGNRVIRYTIPYGKDNELIFNYNICSGFNMYIKGIIKHVGYMDERYSRINVLETLEHTYRIIKSGLHPAVWYYADINKSWEYLESMDISRDSNNQEYPRNFRVGMEIFKKDYGSYPNEIGMETEDNFKKHLVNLKETYSK